MTNPSSPPGPVSRFSAWRPAVVWIIVAVGWLRFFMATLTIREANRDDLVFQRAFDAGARYMWHYIVSWGPLQARHYGIFAFLPIWGQDLITNQWLYQI